MPVLGKDEIQEENLDELALKTFLKALEILGGPRKLIVYRNLTWVPSLIEACYAVVLREKHSKTETEIAEFLGLTKQTVRNILTAKTDKLLEALEEEIKSKEIKTHIAGALAKLAFQEVNKSEG